LKLLRLPILLGLLEQGVRDRHAVAFRHWLNLHLIAADANLVSRSEPLVGEVDDPHPTKFVLGLHHMPEINVVPLVRLVKIVAENADRDEHEGKNSRSNDYQLSIHDFLLERAFSVAELRAEIGCSACT